MPLYYKKGSQMYVKIKRKLAVITRAKRRILYSKWKEVMEDKCAPCDSYKHVHLSISGTILGDTNPASHARATRPDNNIGS